MDLLKLAGAFALCAGPSTLAIMTAVEARRVRRYLRCGVRAEGEIIGEELGGLRNNAPYPVVRFRDAEGVARQFRSLISKRTSEFFHPEKVVVIYLPESPDRAELFSGLHPYKHLIVIACATTLACICSVCVLPQYHAP